MDASDFAYLQGLALRRAGLMLWTEKRFLAESRLEDLAREMGFVSAAALVGRARADDGGEAALAVVEALTPSETAFFRDPDIFERLGTEVLPLLARARAGSRRLRVWCAGMGRGPEVFSLAMLFLENSPVLAGFTVEILGTDLSRRAVEQAASGRFSQWEVQKGLPIGRVLRHLRRVDHETWEVLPALRAAVTLRNRNVLQPLPEPGLFDLVLFRNVLSTAEAAAKPLMLSNVLRSLAPDGVLMLGASETMLGLGLDLAPAPGLRGFYSRMPRMAAAARPAPAVA